MQFRGSGLPKRLQQYPVVITFNGAGFDLRFLKVAFPDLRLPPIHIDESRLWWPVQVGKQELYPLDLSVEVQGQVSDSAHIRFGVSPGDFEHRRQRSPHPPGLPISRSGAFQTLLPLCGSPGIHRLRRPGCISRHNCFSIAVENPTTFS
jgi:hypothetical protein